MILKPSGYIANTDYRLKIPMLINPNKLGNPLNLEFYTITYDSSIAEPYKSNYY